MAAYVSKFEGDDSEESFRAFMSPEQIDQFIRQSIQFCWMALPKDRRNMDELEKQIRRLVERALKDAREDREAFGHS